MARDWLIGACRQRLRPAVRAPSWPLDRIHRAVHGTWGTAIPVAPQRSWAPAPPVWGILTVFQERPCAQGLAHLLVNMERPPTRPLGVAPVTVGRAWTLTSCSLIRPRRVLQASGARSQYTDILRSRSVVLFCFQISECRALDVSLTVAIARTLLRSRRTDRAENPQVRVGRRAGWLVSRDAGGFDAVLQERSVGQFHGLRLL